MLDRRTRTGTGVRYHIQVGSLAALWEPLAAALKGLDGTGRDVIIDAGRLGLVGSPEPLIYTPDPAKVAELGRLTDRELQVLRLVARGMSNTEIARKLLVTDATAKTHVSNVLTKLTLRDRVHGVIYAYESGLVRPGD